MKLVLTPTRVLTQPWLTVSTERGKVLGCIPPPCTKNLTLWDIVDWIGEIP